MDLDRPGPGGDVASKVAVHLNGDTLPETNKSQLKIVRFGSDLGNLLL